MPVVRIEGPHDARVADYRSLSDRELLRARDLFVAEGRLVVERVISDGLAIRSLMLSPVAYSSMVHALVSLPSSAPIYLCESEWFQEITGFNLHRGCLALVNRPAPLAASTVLSRARTVVVLEAVADADNVGGVFRNAAAFGADAVLLSPTSCDPLYRKAIRTSMGASLRVPFVRLEAWPDPLDEMRACGLTLVALTPQKPSETLERFAAIASPTRVALLVGNEGSGLSDEAMRRADYRVRIPVRSAVDSLNLAVTVGIVLARLSDAGSL